MLHLLILLSLFSCTFSLSWTKITPTGAIPTNVTGGAFQGDGLSTAYLISGHREIWFPTGEIDITFTDAVSSFNKNTNVWTTVSVVGAKPVGRAYPASTFSHEDSSIYMYGGTTFDNSYGSITLFGDLWKFNTLTNTFTQITPIGAGPGPRAGATLCKVGANLYLFGGISSILEPFGLPLYTDELWKFCLVTLQWTQLSSGPSARQVPQEICRVASFTINGGEYFNPDTFEVETPSDTWTYNALLNTWTNQTVTTNIPARNYGASFSFNLLFGIYGGEDDQGTQNEGCGAPFGTNIQNDLWFFRPLQNKWERFYPTGTAPPPLKRASGATFGLKAYIFSGFNFICPGPGQVYNSDVYVLSNL